MDRSSAIFCVGSLAACLAISAVAFPYAALDRDVVEQARVPQPAETMALVNVGEGFGELPVEELMFYYVETPPAPIAVGAPAAPEIKFGGC
ncbi:hypothetical protein [Marimonas arenosa]|uniref:Uncharacterized protein n=1 Tax=Marimonas arenosa TaxID=1795305 RepID=A0AAE3WDP7_9RHOB|nr:hypothetical protein [Marimonas arenosa]MDQ2089743.1 hypothetical protein [Marimonas arenosa]